MVSQFQKNFIYGIENTNIALLHHKKIVISHIMIIIYFCISYKF